MSIFFIFQSFCKGSDYYYYLSFTNKEKKVQGKVIVDAGRE